jgi:hypothetical protein
MTVDDLVFRELSALQTHIWFLHTQGALLVFGLVGIAWQIRKNGNGRRRD